MRRQSELDALVAQNRALEEDIQLKVRELEERQLLTVAMMDEIAVCGGSFLSIHLKDSVDADNLQTAVGTADDSKWDSVFLYRQYSDRSIFSSPRRRIRWPN